MDQAQRQQAIDNISPEELAKVKAHQARNKSSVAIDDHWLVIAEFTRAFGWGAYQDFKADNISLDEMMTLVEANRRLEYAEMFRFTQACFVGSVSAQAKSPTSTFTKLVATIIKKSKADK